MTTICVAASLAQLLESDSWKREPASYYIRTAIGECIQPLKREHISHIMSSINSLAIASRNHTSRSNVYDTVI